MVIPIFLPDCEECIDCKSKKSNVCSKFPFHVSQWMPRDGTSRFTDLNGETLYHFLWISSFSEYTVLDVANVTKLDPKIPPNRACLLSCGVSTGNVVCVFLIFLNMTPIGYLGILELLYEFVLLCPFDVSISTVFHVSIDFPFWYYVKFHLI